MPPRDDPRSPPPDDCPLERYLHVVAGTWVPRIIWFLRFGPRRFGDLKRDLKSVSPKVLTGKLRALEAEGLVVRRVIDASPPQVEYSLSLRGRAFDPVFEAMARVSAELKRLDGMAPAEDR
ncbi:winged helix-turn-helix transcriptional regulator [Thauera sinica]|uniref:Winged helix-turn-helix transcriptional regulator n=1 Tax=Thauera sinica TaxID=2665146 RepID=A0ABW1AMT8_9RHOO|nr:helix-turn-helix domain-containing protein [Thauera sp. K11]ATE61663.1 transcriptional regulator [Thauera sp. K11]